MGNELLQSSSFGIILFFAGFLNYFLRHNPRGVTQVQITVMAFHELFLDKSVVSSISPVRIERIRFHTFTSVLPFTGSMSNIDPVSYLSTLNSLLCFYVSYFCFALLCFPMAFRIDFAFFCVLFRQNYKFQGGPLFAPRPSPGFVYPSISPRIKTKTSKTASPSFCQHKSS